MYILCEAEFLKHVAESPEKEKTEDAKNNKN